MLPLKKRLDLYLDSENRIAIALIDFKETMIVPFPEHVKTFDRLSNDGLSDLLNQMFNNLLPIYPMNFHIHGTGRRSKDLVIGQIDGYLTIEPLETAVNSPIWRQ
jgi:hypothetical protein